MPPDLLAPLHDLPGVADAATDARQAVDALLTHRAMRRRGGDVAVEAGLRCARASAALEGADLPLSELRGRLDDTSLPAAVRGALRLSAELGGLVETVERAPLQAFARMHVLAASGPAGEDELGRPRTDDPAVAARLATLADVLSASTRAPAVVVAAVVHGELLALAPFAQLSGLVARAAGRAVLVSRGLDPRAVSAPDVGHAEDPSAYAAAAASFASGDVTPWLLHCCAAVRHGAMEGVAICEALLRATP